mmetsp:Transcript_18539/g.25154  ORF Transcript_18539/g.25154 Transcript_18539/m.25154 type:complete len:182 (+) Transcript_18539:903-1448(+)
MRGTLYGWSRRGWSGGWKRTRSHLRRTASRGSRAKAGSKPTLCGASCGNVFGAERRRMRDWYTGWRESRGSSTDEMETEGMVADIGEVEAGKVAGKVEGAGEEEDRGVGKALLIEMVSCLGHPCAFGPLQSGFNLGGSSLSLSSSLPLLFLCRSTAHQVGNPVDDCAKAQPAEYCACKLSI